MNKKVLIIGGVVLAAAAVGGFLIYRNYKKKSASKLPSDSTGTGSSTNTTTEEKAADVKPESKPAETVSAPESKPAETKSPEAPKPKFGMGSIKDKIASQMNVSQAPLPTVEKYKYSFPLRVNRLTGLRTPLNIPENTEFEGRFIKMNDEDTGSFEGRYRGQSFLTTLSKSKLTKL